uniref:Uncharacterized protein n=1 Tax=Oryzias melastigma TaxID=30732 RepID=A0A3B3DT97_ORYME
ESFQLFLFVIAQHMELLDVVQGLLLTLQPDDVGIRNNPLCKIPQRILEGGREQQHLAVFSHDPPLDSDALVPEALSVNHHVGLVQHKHADFLEVDHFVLSAPVQECSWRSDDDLLLALTSVPSDGISHFHIRAELPHMLDDLTDLQGQLVCWGDAEALRLPGISVSD